MLVIEDRCCDCAAPGYPCRGSDCPNMHVKIHCCDICGEEIVDDVYDVDGDELCEECLKERFRKDLDD